MKKILTIFLTTILLLITPVYIFAEESTDITVEETVTEEDTTTDDTDETTLAETLEEEETDSGISVWTVLFAIVGASLFIGVAYLVLKNFNL